MHEPRPPPSMASALFFFAIVVVTANTAASVWRSRGDGRNLFFALFSCAEMALLFWCIRSFDRLPADSGASVERRKTQLKLAVWALATALSVTFCGRVSELMPCALAAAACWVMVLLVAAVGFYMLFVYHHL